MTIKTVHRTNAQDSAAHTHIGAVLHGIIH